MAKRTDPVLTAAIARRLKDALDRAGLRPKDVEHRTQRGIDERLVRRYLKGETTMGVAHAILLAALCNVTLDWLLAGQDTTPALDAWLDRNPAVPAAGARWMRSLPLGGIRASDKFFRALWTAWEAGASELLTPAEAAAAIHQTAHEPD